MTADRPAALFLFDDRIAWSSSSFTGAQTRRPTCALLIGAYRELDVTLDGQAPLRTRAVLLGPTRLAPPIGPDDIPAMERQAAWCMEQYRVRLSGAFDLYCL